MKYYVLIIQSGVDAEARGPYTSHWERNRAAREIVQFDDYNSDYDSIFRMDVENDVPETYSFAHDELYSEETA